MQLYEYSDEEKAALLPKCPRRTMSGGQCELTAGHPGHHYRSWPNGSGGYSWTDESETAAVDQYEKSRKR